MRHQGNRCYVNIKVTSHLLLMGIFVFRRMFSVEKRAEDSFPEISESSGPKEGSKAQLQGSCRPMRSQRALSAAESKERTLQLEEEFQRYYFHIFPDQNRSLLLSSFNRAISRASTTSTPSTFYSSCRTMATTRSRKALPKEVISS
jgi:hypothetical protein